MRLKRSALAQCPNGCQKRLLDWKIDYGGGRYMDMYAIECVGCGVHPALVYSTEEALKAWDVFATTNKETSK